MRCGALSRELIDGLVKRYRVHAEHVEVGMPIPGSYWGDPEAGLVGYRIYWRDDTPVHSLLHELAHFVCMTPERRGCLDTDAGGDDREECAACFLEVLLADSLPPFSATLCLADMDRWGYSFREGSAAAWFSGDGREARDWLLDHDLIDGRSRPRWMLRGEAG